MEQKIQALQRLGDQENDKREGSEEGEGIEAYFLIK